MNYETGDVPPLFRDVQNKCPCGKTWVGPRRVLCPECMAEAQQKAERDLCKPLAGD